jgi:hypothetical protein
VDGGEGGGEKLADVVRGTPRSGGRSQGSWRASPDGATLGPGRPERTLRPRCSQIGHIFSAARASGQPLTISETARLSRPGPSSHVRHPHSLQAGARDRSSIRVRGPTRGLGGWAQPRGSQSLRVARKGRLAVPRMTGAISSSATEDKSRAARKITRILWLPFVVGSKVA